MRRHLRCPIKAMDYSQFGATCTSCGLRWVLGRFGYSLVSAPRVVA